MLPADFEWRDWLGDPALYLGDHQLASITTLESGKFRICLKPGSLGIRYEFFDSMEVSRAYVELWATKYENRLRNGPF
jgi:hypothetical protein